MPTLQLHGDIPSVTHMSWQIIKYKGSITFHLHLYETYNKKIPNFFILYKVLNTTYKFTIHFILLELINLGIPDKKHKSWRSSLCNFLQPPTISFNLGPNNLLSTLFSNTFSLCSSLKFKDQVSYPYKTIGKIIVSYISIFTCLYSMWEDERFWTEW
jgi:hypothetical protein